MKEFNLSVESFSVSYSIETYRGGTKKSHFVNATIRADPAISVDDLPLARLEASYQVTKSVYQDAVARGDMDQDEAVDRLRLIKENYDRLRERLLQARKSSSQ